MSQGNWRSACIRFFPVLSLLNERQDNDRRGMIKFLALNNQKETLVLRD
jgi:hypothetical protein